ncbi:MAG: hypothetical protein WCT24_03600 [Patescibacteria group bacterium]|jgi:hypothetical protein
MSSDFGFIFKISHRYSRLAIFGLFFLCFGSILASAFLNTTESIGLFFVILLTLCAFANPNAVLAGFLFFLPFELFIQKWIPGEIFVSQISHWFLYVLALVVLWRVISHRISLHGSKKDIPFFVFLGMLAFSILTIRFQTGQYLLAPTGIHEILWCGLLGSIVILLRPSILWVKRVFIGLAVILSLEIVLGFGQLIFGQWLDLFLLPPTDRFDALTTFWDYGAHVFGTFGRYDWFGGFVAFGLLMIASILIESRIQLRYRKILSPIFLLGLPILALSYSLQSWLGFLCGFLLILFFHWKQELVEFMHDPYLKSVTIGICASSFVMVFAFPSVGPAFAYWCAFAGMSVVLAQLHGKIVV